jgi:hypothetical protein
VTRPPSCANSAFSGTFPGGRAACEDSLGTCNTGGGAYRTRASCEGAGGAYAPTASYVPDTTTPSLCADAVGSCDQGGHGARDLCEASNGGAGAWTPAPGAWADGGGSVDVVVQNIDTVECAPAAGLGYAFKFQWVAM